MRVILYLERFADLGETCLLSEKVGLTGIETTPEHDVIMGDIDSRIANQLTKVKGVSHILKGQHAVL